MERPLGKEKYVTWRLHNDQNERENGKKNFLKRPLLVKPLPLPLRLPKITTMNH